MPQRGIKVHFRTFSVWGCLVAFVSTLVGCADTYEPPATTNVNAAVSALLRQPRSYTLYDGGYESAILSISQGSTASYKGANYDTTILTTTFRSGGGVPSSTDVQTVWFQTGTLLEFFILNSVNGCGLATSASALPTAASLESTFPFASFISYSTCNAPAQTETGGTAKQQGTVTQTASYSLIYGIPMVCINTVNSFFRSTEANCVEITDTNGTLGPRALVSLATGNIVRQFTNF
jgi:hypothetical protein